MRALLIKILPEFFVNLLGLAGKMAENKGEKIPWQEPSIRSEAVKDSITDTIIQDKRQDKDLRREPKDYLEFATEEEFMCALRDTEQIKTKALYVGAKEEILRTIKRDYAKVLTTEQERKLRKDIKGSKKEYFIIRIAPQTVH